VFLSYTWSDTDVADQIDCELTRRGIPVWRDRRDMRFGHTNETLVKQAIAELCSGFILLYTDEVLESRFILDIELPAMEARRRKDPNFFTGAINCRSASWEEANSDLREVSGYSLAENLGGSRPEDPPDGWMREVANQISISYLRSQDSETSLNLQTRNPAASTDDLLLATWSPPLTDDPEETSDSAWSELAIAAGDIRLNLEAAQGQGILSISGRMHLSAALLLGWTFRQSTQWKVDLKHEYVPAISDLAWTEPTSWELSTRPGALSPGEDLEVRINVSQAVSAAVRATKLAPPRAEIEVFPKVGEPGKTNLDANEANDLAAAIAHQIRQARSEYGTLRTHLFAACPWPLITLIGWHLSSSGEILMYEASLSRDSYVPSLTLP
jgi:hypothetical protein